MPVTRQGSKPCVHNIIKTERIQWHKTCCSIKYVVKQKNSQNNGHQWDLRHYSQQSTCQLCKARKLERLKSVTFDCDITVQVIKLLTPDRSFINRASAKHTLTPIAVIKSIIKPTTKSVQEQSFACKLQTNKITATTISSFRKPGSSF